MLRGWVDLSSDKPHTVKKSIKYLEHGIQDTRDVLGLMGKVGSGEARGGSVPSQGPPSLGPHLVDEEQSPREGQGHRAALGPPQSFLSEFLSVSCLRSPQDLCSLGSGGLFSLYPFCFHPLSLSSTFSFLISPVKLTHLVIRERRYVFCIF